MSRLPEADYAYRRLEQIPVGGMITQEEMECLLGCPLPGYARLFGGEVRFALPSPRMMIWKDVTDQNPVTFKVEDLLRPPQIREVRFRIDYWKPLLQSQQAMNPVARPLLLQYFRIQ